MDMILLAERIKTTREALNISAEELATAIGVNKATIHRYEKAEFKSIKQSSLEKIAKVLHTNVDYLTGKSDNRYTLENAKELSHKDTREISEILSVTTELLKQEGLMFDGEPADEESIKSIIDAMEVGLEMAKRRNKEKYTPNKYRK